MRNKARIYLLGGAIIIIGLLTTSCIINPEGLAGEEPSLAYTIDYYSLIPHKDLAYSVVEDNILMQQYSVSNEDFFEFERFRSYEDIYELYSNAGNSIGFIMQNDNVVAGAAPVQGGSQPIFFMGLERTWMYSQEMFPAIVDRNRIAGEYVMLSPNRSFAFNLDPLPVIIFPLRIDEKGNLLSDFEFFWESPQFRSLIAPDEVFEEEMSHLYTHPDTIGQWQWAETHEVQVPYEIHGETGEFDGYITLGYTLMLLNQKTKDTYIGIRYSQLKKFIRELKEDKERAYLCLSTYGDETEILSIYLTQGGTTTHMLSQYASEKEREIDRNYGGAFGALGKGDVLSSAMYSNASHHIFLGPLLEEDVILMLGFSNTGKIWMGVGVKEEFGSIPEEVF